MVTVKKFEDLQAWQEAKRLVNVIYSLVKKPPFSKDFALRDQIIRSSISIMSNIAEGFDSGSDQQFIQFLVYSKRSTSELQSQLYIALDNHYINEKEFYSAYNMSESVRKMNSSFISYLKKK